ncbi:MAG: ABC transporter permease [Thermodesulfobacteriota bacterium]
MIWNAFLLALREIRRNALRSFLTILGVVIGVAAVITLVTVGTGVTAKVTEDMSKLGSNMLLVRPGQFRGPGGGSSSAEKFAKSDVEAVRREVASLSATAPASSAGATAIFGNTNWTTQVTGTDNQFFVVRDWTIEKGRLFSEGELRSGRAVCVLGATVRRELFGTMDPIGQRIRLKKIPFQVIGLLNSKGATGMGHDQDDIILVPLQTLQRRISGNQDIESLLVSAKSGASTQRVQSDLELLMRERRHIGPGMDDDFSVGNMQEIADTMTATTKTLTALLGAVAAVSLLVGGIGIMNIMLVSVTERTREIGTRLAIGAQERDVLVQFLVEAVVLSSLGGLVGVLLALGSSIFLVRGLGVPFVFDPEINIIAFLFSAAVGVVFGYFPARRAARLDPIEALRHE